MTKTHKIIYWVSTTFVSLGMLGGGLAQLFRVKQNVEGIVHLGYPEYIMTILGSWKLLGVIAILVPKFPLVKEWAYAGFCFLMTGALYSHIASGDPAIGFIGPVILFIMILISWYFRPADRKIGLVNQKKM